jgi:cardiolipin synthase
MIPATYIPNLITCARIVAVPFFVWLLIDQQYERALLLLLLMGLSDALDGFLARCYGWKTTLGSYLDPIADKVMLLVVYVAFALFEWVPWWLTAIVVARDCILMVGAVYYHYSTSQLKMEPSSISKINTFVQIILAITLVYHQIAHFHPFVLNVLMTLVVYTTILSGYKYVTQWYARAEKVHINNISQR